VSGGVVPRVDPTRTGSAAPRWAVRVALATSLIAIVLLVSAPAGHSVCGVGANPIVEENCKTGDPQSQWEISQAAGVPIEGFTTDISVNRGSTVDFKIDAGGLTNYHLDIYRMGYYSGAGARRVAANVIPSSVANQQPCDGPDAAGLIDCGNWVVSASWAVPSDAVSGIYFAAAVRADGTVANHIFFVVRDDASHSDLYYQTSDTTWQAYNDYLGKSLYTGGPLGGSSGKDTVRAAKVSYNRPFVTRRESPEDFVFNAEYPMVRWLERNGYDISYETGVDSDRFGQLIRNHRVFVSTGHDEYWSGQQRANVEAARDAGVNLAFFSGNEIFWKTRWESSHGSSYRTLVSYKETHADAKIDPNPAWTGTWMDPRFNTENRKPQNALSGTLFTVNDGTESIEVPAEYRALRLWRNTNITDATQALGDGTLGYEWDSDVDNGARPAGLFDFSSAKYTSGLQVLKDYGSTYGPGEATHSITMYRAPSGALVFGAGTVQWAWGLDEHHDRGSAPPDKRLQQATVNLLADMHAQPATPQTDLVPATASTDTIAPQSSITSAPATVTAGQQATVVGTADDAGGGHVAGVEVSLDGGATWHAAAGRENWAYVWTPSTSGQLTVRSRAVDDSGNLGPRGPDTAPPNITTLAPANGASGVDPGIAVRASFDEALKAYTVSGDSFTLRSAAGGSVAADVSYDAATRTISLVPRAPLAWSTLYTATVKGGAGGVTDAAGNPLAQDRTWSFTTAGSASAGSSSAGAAAGRGTSSGGASGTGPRVHLSPRTIRVSKAGTVKLRVACPSGTGGCKVKLRLERAHRVLAAKTLSVSAGKTRTFTLTLSRAARRDLLRKGSLRVTSIAAATDRAGHKATSQTSTLLLAPKRR
jgi:hypothetical protein